MQKALTISIEADTYNALQRVVGRGKISKFLQDLARPHVMKEDLSTAYQVMAADSEREKEALEWRNGLIGDVAEQAVLAVKYGGLISD